MEGRQKIFKGARVLLLHSAAVPLLLLAFAALYEPLDFQHFLYLNGGVAVKLMLASAVIFCLSALCAPALGIFRGKREPEKTEGRLMRFRDIFKKTRLLVDAASVLFIKAEENYVTVCYQNNSVTENYTLRASMSSLEELCAAHGIVRCQRSYYVNALRIRLLRKEAGSIYADLDLAGVQPVPVSKKYFDKVSRLL